MKTRIIALVAGLLLALGTTVALPASPAQADNWDDYSTWFCAAHRPSGTVLFHSWPYTMSSGFVGYWCRAGFIYGKNWQYWVHWDQGAGTSWQPWPYQECKPTGYVFCGTAGH